MYYFIINYSNNMILSVLTSDEYDYIIKNNINLSIFFDCDTLRIVCGSYDLLDLLRSRYICVCCDFIKEFNL